MELQISGFGNSMTLTMADANFAIVIGGSHKLDSCKRMGTGLASDSRSISEELCRLVTKLSIPSVSRVAWSTTYFLDNHY